MYTTNSSYLVLEESGLIMKNIFKLACTIEETLIGSGTGPSKKEAEQAAAKVALSYVQETYKEWS